MSKEMKVGMFFVLGMVILGVLTFYAGGFEDWLKKRYTLRAYFDKVDGLDGDDFVTLAGVEVGKVKGMKISDTRVEVVLLIDGGAVIRSDSVARIESESLLGGKYVGITVGSPDARSLKDGDVIQTEEAADLTRIMQDVADVADDLRTMVSNFNANQEKIASQIEGILDENRANIRTSFESLSRIMTENEEGIKEIIDGLRDASPQLREVAESVNNIAKKIESGEGTIGKLVQDDKLYDDMRELSASLREASATMTRILGDNEEDIKTIVASLKEATPKLELTMNRIDSITQKIEKGEGTIGKLVQDEELYREATRMLKEARHAAEDVREQVPIITFTSVIFGAFQ
ncbi:MAG: MCE family protein [Candidatus Hydrogenedentota bacterium]|nr:MAG: MCE family protein [Candidatus Hydrogenedentota bacterium]